MGAWHREPLVHFTVLGALLFAAHGLWAQHSDRAAKTITVKTAEIERQAVILAGELLRPPSDAEIAGLVYAYAEEEALVREARALGLDEGDTIIRRRLAQKMRFLMEDIDAASDPAPAELAAWFETHRADFALPPRRAFSHIFLSPQKRGDGVQTQAEDLAKDLADEANDQNWRALGDPFMMERSFEALSAVDIQRLFGEDFARAIFTLADTRDWQGPIASAFGLHIIRLDAVLAPETPGLEAVKDRVLVAYREARRLEQNREKLSALLGKYDIKIEGLEALPAAPDAKVRGVIEDGLSATEVNP